MENFNILYPVSYLLILLGLIGAVVPVLPGSLLIWLGAFLYAQADGFRAFGWPTLIVLGLMVLVTWGSDLLLTTLITRKTGASWKATAGAIAGGIPGGLLLSGVFPLVGTVFGAIVGAVIGVLLVEYLGHRDWRAAFDAARGYIIGYLASAALQLFLCLTMIAIFLVQVFVI
ncbi:MAG: DUF456 domain-containing protein [Chloroflexi bacterium]|nr:DUF456 domain-containing protein [Chloroflexota bacterium]